MAGLIVLDPSQKTFEANGKMYYIESSISFDRYRDMQKMEVELSFASTMEHFREGIKKIYDTLNSRDGKMADAAVICHNLLLGAASLDEKWTPPVMKMCALFINTKDEDRTTINQAQIDEKINDWTMAGIDAVSFFRLALGSIPGFQSAYNEASQLGSPSPTNPQSTSAMTSA